MCWKPPARIVGVAGASYTFSEVGAGTPAANLANYVTSYSCTNGATGTTTSGSLTFPAASGSSGANVTCTFTNAVRTADLSITKPTPQRQARATKPATR